MFPLHCCLKPFLGAAPQGRERLTLVRSHSVPFWTDQVSLKDVCFYRNCLALAEPLCLTPCCTEPQDKGDTGRANGRKACSHFSGFMRSLFNRVSCFPVQGFMVFPLGVSCCPFSNESQRVLQQAFYGSPAPARKSMHHGCWAQALCICWNHSL